MTAEETALRDPVASNDVSARIRVALTSRAAIEIAIIFALCFVHAGGAPPDVNEAHYLAKARRFYDPAFCGPDFFLATKDAHVAFFATFGLIASVVPLPAAAWISRSICWLVLAAGWSRLARATSLSLTASLLGCGAFLAATTWFHQSGEWVVGGAEGKSVAYGCVLWGVAEWIARRPNRCLVALGLATAFHVLVGGWTTALILAATVCDSTRRPLLRKAGPGVVLGGLLAAIGVVPALLLTQGVSSDVASAAHEIYVFERLRHHLSILAFEPRRIVAFGVLCVATGLLAATLRRDVTTRPLVWLAAGSLLLCGIGAAIDAYATIDRAFAAGMLRFYWFRMADAFVPLAGAILAARLFDVAPRRAARPAIAAGLAAIVVWHLGSVLYARVADPRGGAEAQSTPRARSADWLATCRFLREHSPEDALFLTPRRQQTFLWEAQRAEIVNFKNLPQDAASVLAWKRRMRDVYPTAPDGTPRPLAANDYIALRRKYGYRFLVREKSFVAPPLPSTLFTKVYSSPGGRGVGYEVFFVDFP